MNGWIHRPSVHKCLHTHRNTALRHRRFLNGSLVGERIEQAHIEARSDVAEMEMRHWKNDQVDWSQFADFWVVVGQLSRKYSASLTSGWRTQLHNQRVGGHAQSKHTFDHGWGMAADLWFENPADRQFCADDVRAHGYYWYVGDDYDPRRLHIQGWAKGEEPRWEE